MGVPGLTVDRQCASGLAAIDLAAQLVRGGAGMVLAGGVESACTAPWRSWPPVDGAEPVRYQRAPFAPASRATWTWGWPTTCWPREAGIPRERQDAYAARSHARAVAAQQAGGFDAEIVPVAGCVARRPAPLRLTVAAARAAAPGVPTDGTVTAGNSCGINDGAAAVAVVDAGDAGAPGRARPARAGHRDRRASPPTGPGLGWFRPSALAPGPAGPDARRGRRDRAQRGVRRAGAGLLRRARPRPRARVCTEGGALALGHPWGASGAVLAVRLFARLVTRGQRPLRSRRDRGRRRPGRRDGGGVVLISVTGVSHTYPGRARRRYCATSTSRWTSSGSASSAPTGPGKSTFVRLLNGLVVPVRGHA